MGTPLVGDATQEYLVAMLSRTEQCFRGLLRTFDASADCEIVASADLGFPGSVIRLAGGFTSGCFVQWDCRVPVIPVDSVCAVDLSTLFVIHGDSVESAFTERRLHEVRQLMETSRGGHVWNFSQSNHFISLGRRLSDGADMILMHSSEAEFGNQPTGLFPTPTNWYGEAIRTYSDEHGTLRYICGSKAEVFARVSQTLLQYAKDRHRLIAELILGKHGEVVEELHKPHFYLDGPQSLVLGTYLCAPDESVPLFSDTGKNVLIVQAKAGGTNQIQIKADGRVALLLPHGWGREVVGPITIGISDNLLTFCGAEYPIRPGSTITENPFLRIRTYSDDPSSPLSFTRAIEHHTKLDVLDLITQRISISQAGYLVHDKSFS